MKKVHFFLAFTALLLANILVYACQKDNPAPSLPAKAIVENTAVENRSPDCPQVRIINGVGLTICGVNTGTTCTLCVISSLSASVTSSPQTFSITNTKFLLTNPTGTSIMVDLDFGCASGPQTFTIAANSQQYIGVGIGPNHCCVATLATC